MSWSVGFMGKPENVAKALEDYVAKMTDGQTKIEYEAALPHMVALVKENFGDDTAVVRIEANGHGYANNGEQKTRNLNCKVERIYAQLV